MAAASRLAQSLFWPEELHFHTYVDDPPRAVIGNTRTAAAVPGVRRCVSDFWPAIKVVKNQSEPAKPTTRRRLKGLTFLRFCEHSVLWLAALLDFENHLVRRCSPAERPFGMGGTIGTLIVTCCFWCSPESIYIWLQSQFQFFYVCVNTSDVFPVVRLLCYWRFVFF